MEEVTAQLRLAHGQLAALESSLPGEVAAAQMALAEREAVVRSRYNWWCVFLVCYGMTTSI